MVRDEGEPIVWGNNSVRESVRRVNGKRIVERFPQSAGNGENGRRWERRVDAAGNTVNAPFTNSGSIFDRDDSSSRYILRKDRNNGGFALRECPVALVLLGPQSGGLSKYQIDESLWGARPCEPGSFSEARPCPHALEEKRLRMIAQAAAMLERLPKMQTLEDQVANVVADQRVQNQDLVQGIAGAFADAIRTVKDEQPAVVVVEKKSSK